MAVEAAEVLDSMDPEISGLDPKLLQQLSDDNVDIEIIKDELHHMSPAGAVSATTCRERLVLMLRHSATEAVKLSLVLLDAILILAIIILDIYIVEAELEDKNESAAIVLTILKTRCDNSTLGLVTDPHSLDKAFETLTDSVENNPALNYSIGKVTLDGKHYHTEAAMKLSELTHWVEGLHYASIAILSSFVVDLVLKLIGYGKKFFYYKLEVVDGVIVIASLAIDIFLTNNTIQDLSQALLIVFLMWRLIRIFNGMMLTTKARTNFRIRVLKSALRSSEDKACSLREQVAALEREVKNLQLVRMINAKSCPQLDTVSLVSASSKGTIRSIKSLMKNSLTQMAQWNVKVQRRAKRRALASGKSISVIENADHALANGVYKRVQQHNGFPGMHPAASESRLSDLHEAPCPDAEKPPAAATERRWHFHSHPTRKRSSSEADLTEDSVAKHELSGSAGKRPSSSRRLSADDQAAFDVNSSATSGVVSRQSSCDLTSLDTGASLTSLAPPSSPSAAVAAEAAEAADEANNNNSSSSSSSEHESPNGAADDRARRLGRSARRDRKLLTWCVNETASGSDSAAAFTRL